MSACKILQSQSDFESARDLRLVAECRTKDYHPESERWRSKGLILFGSGQTSLFGYSFNHRVNFIDPARFLEGLSKWICKLLQRFW